MELRTAGRRRDGERGSKQELKPSWDEGVPGSLQIDAQQGVADGVV